MAQPTYSAPPPQQPPARPGTVTLSSYLLWAVAAVSLVSGILSLSVVGKLSDAYSDLYEGTAAAGTESIIVGASVVGVIFSILFAGGYVVLSIFNNRGRNGSRITTWVLGGIMLCCNGVGLAGSSVTSAMNMDSAGGPSQAEVQSRLDAALPSWYESLTVVLTVISLLAMLGAVILLALPASNAFFRRPAAAGFDPSLPYPGQQPQYPGQQPQYPGQQPQYPGQQPQYPTYPTGPQQPGQQPGQPPYPQSGPPPAYPQSGPPAYPQSGPPAQQPPAAPPATPPGQDPWGRPESGQQKPPSDPTSQP